jgi:hypothetical protein
MALTTTELPCVVTNAEEVALIRGMAGSGWVLAEFKSSLDGVQCAEVHAVTWAGHFVLKALAEHVSAPPPSDPSL